jgi:hypothetical protein
MHDLAKNLISKGETRERAVLRQTKVFSCAVRADTRVALSDRQSGRHDDRTDTIVWRGCVIAGDY